MENIKKRMRDMLERACNRFNSTNRAVEFENDKSLRCKYETSDGNRCAIGAEIPEYLMTEDVKNYVGSVDHLFDLYPKIKNCRKFKDVQITFLKSLQLLHDSEQYWDEGGLSDAGMKRKELIISLFDI